MLYEAPIVRKLTKGKLATQTLEMLQVRPTQESLYSNFVFDEDHIVGSYRGIPVEPGDLVLAPGHIDPLYQRGLIKTIPTESGAMQSDELYKVSDSGLKEGLQKLVKTQFSIKNPQDKIDDPRAADSFSIKKNQDEVWGRIHLIDLLQRKEMSDSLSQTVLLQMIKQQLGVYSLAPLLEETRNKLNMLQKVGSSAEIIALRKEVEKTLRTRLRQEITIAVFLKQLEGSYPDVKNIYSIEGTETLVSQIEKLLERDLGSQEKRGEVLNLEDFVRDKVNILFPASPVAA
jgi:hypothetical protein